MLRNYANEVMPGVNNPHVTRYCSGFWDALTCYRKCCGSTRNGACALTLNHTDSQKRRIFLQIKLPIWDGGGGGGGGGGAAGVCR